MERKFLWVAGWALAIVAGLGLLIGCNAIRERNSESEPETHCHVLFFSGGALVDQWEAERVTAYRSSPFVQFESDGLDYQLSGDVVVECGHEVALN